MRVNIDESGRHRQPGDIYTLARLSARQIADRRDAAAADADISDTRGRTCPIDDAAAGKNHIEGNRLRRRDDSKQHDDEQRLHTALALSGRT
jgi:hypothetical protein